MIVKDYLKNKRESAGFNQTAGAKAIGIAQGFLADIEKGQRLPSEDVIEKIALAYNLTAEEKKELTISIGLEKAPEALKAEFLLMKKELEKNKKIKKVEK